MHSTTFTDGTPITPYQATAYAEGFEEGSNKDQLHAWSYLIGTKLCYSLQGFFGRTARTLIEEGIFAEDGTILRNPIE
jgi:hypothetical protein